MPLLGCLYDKMAAKDGGIDIDVQLRLIVYKYYNRYVTDNPRNLCSNKYIYISFLNEVEEFILQRFL